MSKYTPQQQIEAFSELKERLLHYRELMIKHYPPPKKNPDFYYEYWDSTDDLVCEIGGGDFGFASSDYDSTYWHGVPSEVLLLEYDEIEGFVLSQKRAEEEREKQWQSDLAQIKTEIREWQSHNHEFWKWSEEKSKERWGAHPINFERYAHYTEQERQKLYSEACLR